MKPTNGRIAIDLGVALKSAAVRLEVMEGGDEIVRQGAGQGELHDDTEMKADRELGIYLQRKLTEIPGAGIVTVEGLEADVVLNPDGLWITCDPLDESLGWRRGRHVLEPYAGVITVLRKKEGALFGDVIAAAIKDYRPGGPLWTAWLDEESNAYVCHMNGEPTRVSPCPKLTLTDQMGYAEGYYPSNRVRVAHALREFRGRVRNSGCAAREMALVSTGASLFWLCDQQKQHELGAAMACTLGAGGVALGKPAVAGEYPPRQYRDLRTVPYIFNAQTDVILANNANVGNELAERLTTERILRPFNP